MGLKEGRTLQELALEVQAQHAKKQDWVVGAGRIRFGSGPWGTQVSVDDKGYYGVNQLAHGQMAAYLGVPKAYYDRMAQEQPALLDENVNTWLRARPQGERRLVRILDKTMRALLSDRYRILDNIDLLTYILPELSQYPTLRYESQEITDRRMYIKVVQPTLIMDVQPGDPVQMGILIKNSEVGASALVAQGFVVRQKDRTGMVVEDWGQKRHHVGRSTYVGDEGEAVEHITDETMKLDDKVFFMKVRDTVRYLLTEDVFYKIVLKMQEAAGVIVKKPEAAVAVLARKAGLSEDQRSGVLDFLIKGGDMSMLGLSFAVAQLSGTADDYDAASDLEALSGRLMSLTVAESREIADATSVTAGIKADAALAMAR